MSTSNNKHGSIGIFKMLKVPTQKEEQSCKCTVVPQTKSLSTKLIKLIVYIYCNFVTN